MNEVKSLSGKCVQWESSRPNAEAACTPSDGVKRHKTIVHGVHRSRRLRWAKVVNEPGNILQKLAGG